MRVFYKNLRIAGFCDKRRKVLVYLIISILVIPLAFTAKTTWAGSFEPLWYLARVLIANSPADQSPSPVINCPVFFDNGQFANGFHTLDLSSLSTTGKVKGSITIQNDTIEPDFSSSVAVALTQGTDGIQYLVVAGEGNVTGGKGYFSGVTKVIIRCKYKVEVQNNGDIFLIACVDCTTILVNT